MLSLVYSIIKSFACSIIDECPANRAIGDAWILGQRVSARFTSNHFANTTHDTIAFHGSPFIDELERLAGAVIPECRAEKCNDRCNDGDDASYQDENTKQQHGRRSHELE